MENNANINQNPGVKGVFPGSQSTINSNEINIPGGEDISQNQLLNVNSETNNLSDTKTYIKLETRNSDGVLSGILEIDLISFRERGQESRYLSINTVGAGREGEQSDTTISIDNEADFNRFKKFISDLNWND